MSDVAWLRNAGINGWRVDGVLTPREVLTTGNFWTKALRLVAVADGGRLDRVLCYAEDPLVGGFLGGESLGPPGRGLATLLDGLPKDRTLLHLGPLFEQAGLSMREAPGVGSLFVRGLRAANRADLEAAFRLSEQPRLWHRDTPGALRAQTWALGVACLLREPECRRAVLHYWSEVVRSMVDVEPASLLGVLPYSPPIHPQSRRAAAVFCALAHLDAKGALVLLGKAGPEPYRILDAASKPGAWSPMLGAAVGRVRAALDAMVWE